MTNKRQMSYRQCMSSQEATWIKEALEIKQRGIISSIVPPIFPSYVRILHPARDIDGGNVRWERVCEVTGQKLGAYSQWSILSARSNWAAGTTVSAAQSLIAESPTKGSLDKSSADETAAIIRRVNGISSECTFGVWDGWGWLTSGSGNEFSYKVDSKPVLDLTDRSYHLFCGSQESVVNFSSELVHQPSANIAWPNDRSWFISTEVDFDSTVVGGSIDLCDALMGNEMIETFRVFPEGSLALTPPQ